jgi:starch synthase
VVTDLIMPDQSRLNVLFMSSEATPLVKVGGLADVAGSLPRALRAIRATADASQTMLDIRLVIPYHPQIQVDVYNPRLAAEYSIPSSEGDILTRAFALDVDGLPIYLIAGTPVDQEDAVYSANLEQDGYKYVYFSLAALELSRQLGWKPDILHANDWHTAAAVYSLALNRRSEPFLENSVSVLTVHNLPYLGAMTSGALDSFGLPAADHSNLPSWAQQMALPLGLLSADAIVAVSPGYAKEILTEEYGSGLSAFLNTRKEKISGILNGLDTVKWNPSTDTALETRYSVATLADRAANKAFLQAELGLETNPHLPLLSMVTRIDPQKGVDLAIEALDWIYQSITPGDAPPQLVVLGKGDPFLEQEAQRLEQNYPHHVRTRLMYDERLSHQIYAGADVLIMPSRYEPCGLSQMIAMHYGCIPIAHATGGLSDTILDPQSSKQSTGFLFRHAKAEDLVMTIERALDVFTKETKNWRAIQTRGMQVDFSWDHSAQEYLDLYLRLITSRNLV